MRERATREEEEGRVRLTKRGESDPELKRVRANGRIFID